MNLNAAIDAFQSAFSVPPQSGAWAPGRANLIGEHTDYNDGLVLPVAIHAGILTLAAETDDGQVHVLSREYPEGGVFSINDRVIEGMWYDAVKGVLAQLDARHERLNGLRLYVAGDMQPEAGLSSSAAFMVSLVMSVFALADVATNPVDTAVTARAVENEFFKVPCGILDQMASAVCKEGYALRLDCRDLSTRDIPVPEDVRLLVGYTGVSRRLTNGRYAARLNECRDAVKALRGAGESIDGLRDVTWEMLERHRKDLNPTYYGRALHVVTENGRVDLACKALLTGDIPGLGVLFNASHASLRDQFQVSCAELDIMTEAMVAHDQISGARMVGAGFGGCCLAVLRGEVSEDLIHRTAERYKKRTGKEGKFFPIFPGGGARMVL